MTWTPTGPLPDAFKEVPRLVYREDPHWIPEEEASLDFLFSDRHDYFAHGRAAVEVSGGKARLAGFYPPHLVIDGRRAAFFGFWETLDDLGANRPLFARIERWAKAQGAARLYGPVNFSTFHAYRLRLNQFEAGCFPGEPYNPPYYPDLLQRMGYVPALRYVSQRARRDYRTLAGQVLAAKASFLDGLPDPSLRLEPLTPAFWMAHIESLYALIDLVFQQNAAYTPLSFASFERACGEAFAHRFCPRTSLVVQNGAGEIAAFFLVFPDYAPLVRQGSPDRQVLRDIRYDVHFEKLDKPVFLAKTLGVHPAYRRQGLMNVLAAEAVRRSLPYYHDVLVCTMQDHNHSVRFGLPFADEVRAYALYAKDL